MIATTIPWRATATALLAGVLLAGCGGDAQSGERVIEFTMTENSFTPEHVTVKAGEIVVLRFTNKGEVRHEAVVGDEAVQIANEQQMQQLQQSSTTQPGPTMPLPETTVPAAKGAAAGSERPVAVLARSAHPGMSLPNVVSVEPGATGEITFAFAKPGRMLIGCHEPGHFDAGMVATVDVTG